MDKIHAMIIWDSDKEKKRKKEGIVRTQDIPKRKKYISLAKLVFGHQ